MGQIELDNIGLSGTPADERRYSDERLREAFATARGVAQLMDELGYDVLWTAEHHFQREGYECFPNLIQLGLWLATQTKRLKFGCAFNVLPMWHPIRLAEDYAMADIVTDGRVIMGVGRGYHTREFETFGAPLLDADANRQLFEEQLQLLLQCFNQQSFHHKGKYYECPPPVDYRGYRLKDITVVPRPRHLPVEIWMPIASGKTIDMMARYGLKAMVTLNGEKILDDVIRAYHAACLQHGQKRELGKTSSGARAFFWQAARRRQSGTLSPPMMSASSGLRRSDSCVTPMSRGGHGVHRVRRRACHHCATVSSRKPGFADRRPTSSTASDQSRRNIRGLRIS